MNLADDPARLACALRPSRTYGIPIDRRRQDLVPSAVGDGDEVTIMSALSGG